MLFSVLLTQSLYYHMYDAPVLSVANIETWRFLYRNPSHNATDLRWHFMEYLWLMYSDIKQARRPPLVPGTDIYPRSGIKDINPRVKWILRVQSYLASECRKSYFSERMPPIPLKKTAFGGPNPFFRFLYSPRTWAFYFAIFCRAICCRMICSPSHDVAWEDEE